MHLVKPASALALLLIGFLIASRGTAEACGNGKVLFEDKFQTLDKSWVFAGDSDTPNPGADGLTAAIQHDHDVAALKTDVEYQDVDVCGVAIVTNKSDPGGFFTIRFWLGDNGVHYWAVAYPGKGLYFVERFEKDKKATLVTPKIFNPALVDASGANEFRVRLRGDSGAFIVNGKMVSTFTREPSGGGQSEVGFIGSPANSPEPTSFALKSFEAREPGTDQVAAAPSLIAFCNEFKETIHLAIAFQDSNVWNSEGWITLKPNACETETKHPDLLSFYFRGESDVYDGQRMTFGSDRDFAVKKNDFVIQKADKKAKGAEMRQFSGPAERVSPAQELSITFTADARTAIATGPKPK